MTFAVELHMVVNAWQHTGDSASSTQFVEFVDEVFEILDFNQVDLVRADSGFYGKRCLQALEDYQKDWVYTKSSGFRYGINSITGITLHQKDAIQTTY